MPPAALPAPGAPVPAGLNTLPTGFIRVANGRFADANCREFTFSGWNQCAPCAFSVPELCTYLSRSFHPDTVPTIRYPEPRPFVTS